MANSAVPQIISSNKIEAIKFDCKVSFESFSARNVDSFYDTKIFSPPGRKDPTFFLRLKPKRYYNYTHTHYVKLEFHLVSCCKNLKINYCCAILDKDEQKFGSSKESSFSTSEDKSSLIFECPESELFDLSKGLLPNDTLTFHNELTFLIERDTEQIILFSNHENKFSAQQQIICDLEALYQSKKYCDIILQVKDVQFSAHKMLLSIRSPVFAAMFEHDSKEAQENRIQLHDIEPPVFEQFLQFIYTGKVSLMNSEEVAVELLAAADKYQVDSLKSVCCDHLSGQFSVNSMFNLLLFADLYNASDLKLKAIDFISNQTSIQDQIRGLLQLNEPKKMIEILQKVAEL